MKRRGRPRAIRVSYYVYNYVTKLTANWSGISRLQRQQTHTGIGNDNLLMLDLSFSAPYLFIRGSLHSSTLNLIALTAAHMPTSRQAVGISSA